MKKRLRVSDNESIWRVSVEGERGFLTSDCGLPGLDCEHCSIWSSFRLVAIPNEHSISISRILSPSLAPISRPEFKLIIKRITDQAIACPISTSGPLSGFLPGDTFSPFAWEEKPSPTAEFEPFFRLGNLAFIVQGDRLMNRFLDSKCRLKGVWITRIQGIDEAWGFLIDDRRERLADDGLNRETCSLCGRLDNVKSPEQKRGLGILRSSMLKRKALAREMVPDRDIFITDYVHSWFIKRNVFALFGQELSANKSVTLEKWSIVD